MSTDISIAIIGGGVVGCAVACKLSSIYDNIFLFEKNIGITQGENQSSRNSGVIHSGIYYDRETRPLKAAYCVKGNSLLYDFCKKHKVPALKTGKLIVAVNGEEEEVLEFYLKRARENQVPDVEIIPGSKVRKLEPNVDAVSALLIPTAGIVEPTSLVYRLHTLASQNGAEFMTNTEVTGLRSDDNGVEITIEYGDGNRDKIRAATIINAGGADADRVARMLNPDSPYELDPIKGEAYKFYGHKRPELGLKGMNVYPTPVSVVTPHGRHFTVGVHLTPTFEDLSYPPSIGSTITVGPQLVSVEDRDSWTEISTPAREFTEKVLPYFPGLKDDDLSWHQSGLQARLRDYPDFIIEPDPSCPYMINLLGIDSPGLTSSLAIASRIMEILER